MLLQVQISGRFIFYFFFVNRCTPARHDALLTCTCETPMHFWIKIQSIQIYISARRVSVSWHSLLEDVVTIKANGATATEDVVICVNAHRVYSFENGILVLQNKHVLSNNFQLIKTSCPMLSFHKVSRNCRNLEAINSVI